MSDQESTGNSYHPNSNDAVFARLHAQMDNMNTTLNAILAQTQKTNGRVTELEHERWKQRGAIAATLMIAGAVWTAATKFLK